MEIEKNDPDQRESWLEWLPVFMKRGLRPIDSFVVHGPHQYPADRMWGEAECEYYARWSFQVKFLTSQCYSIRDIKRVHIYDTETNERFPILKANRLPKEWSQEIKDARRELAALRRST